MEVDLYGNDTDDLSAANKQVIEVMNSIDGIVKSLPTARTPAMPSEHHHRQDKAMRMGLTGWVNQQIAAQATTDTTATTLKAGGTSYTVTIVDKTDTRRRWTVSSTWSLRRPPPTRMATP